MCQYSRSLIFFHFFNVSLSCLSLATAGTVFHSLDLSNVVERLGLQLHSVLKLIMLELLIVDYSQHARRSSKAVIVIVSIFLGNLDTIAPTRRPLGV